MTVDWHLGPNGLVIFFPIPDLGQSDSDKSYFGTPRNTAPTQPRPTAVPTSPFSGFGCPH